MNTTTTTAPSGLPESFIVIRTFFIVIIGLLIISGNILSIAVVRGVSTLADSTKVLMTTLSLYDLTVGIISMLSVVPSAREQWVYGQFVCEVVTVVTCASFVMSILSVLFLNIERYIAVTRPYKFPIWCTRRRFIMLVVFASCFSFCLPIGIKLIFGVKSVFLKAPAGCLLEHSSAIGDILILIFGDIAPVTIMFFVYYRIIKVSKRQDLQLNRNRQKKAQADQEKMLKTFIIVTVIFAICYTPNFVTYVVTTSMGVTPPPIFEWVVVWLTISNSMFNVFIYCLFNESFRQVAKRIVMGRFVCCKRSVAPVDIEL
ncbi:octopamine receptor Oamb-like [Asterias rubens]|uniref:octopamine receptor Oamb-like n=1 Tax=Asterias rubens TaxID=7604 RepID=UPI0014550ED5|nr:octopamine receptor Oamb-like [Asterias rubens]